MKRKEPELLFVELKEPSGLRRDVLTATKDVLDCLKQYEEFKTIKMQKQQALDKLKQVVDDLQSLNRRLRNKMPVRAWAAKSASRAAWEREENITGPSPEMGRPKSKLDVLQEELSKIEERLGALE